LGGGGEESSTFSSQASPNPILQWSGSGLLFFFQSTLWDDQLSPPGRPLLFPQYRPGSFCPLDPLQVWVPLWSLDGLTGFFGWLGFGLAFSLSDFIFPCPPPVFRKRGSFPPSRSRIISLFQLILFCFFGAELFGPSRSFFFFLLAPVISSFSPFFFWCCLFRLTVSFFANLRGHLLPLPYNCTHPRSTGLQGSIPRALFHRRPPFFRGNFFEFGSSTLPLFPLFACRFHVNMFIGLIPLCPPSMQTLLPICSF